MYDNLVIVIDDEDHVLIEKKNTPKNSNYYSMDKSEKSGTTSNTPTKKTKESKSSKALQIMDILSRYPVSPLSNDWTHEKVLGCMCVSYGLLVWIIS